MNEILSKQQISDFINHGFVRIDKAFSKATAEKAVDILWGDLPCDRHDPATWTEPVIRLGMYTQRPFIDSVNSPHLHRIFDQLIGTDRWVRCQSVGTFPVRFPSEKNPGDTGMHVDASFPGTDPDNYMEWRVNVKSKGRALLMLVLYSDVSEADAPTIIRQGSHLDVARLLEGAGDAGMSFMELASQLSESSLREEVFATGEAGTIYLCHPFLAHAAQAHEGSQPKFMAQPALLLKGELSVDGEGSGRAPVVEAVRLALGR
ncbi:MAG: phytanoyl-CoA dioxygenase [Imperialibacter sp.]|uniref:phytanoyl-CoA dioxygenase n=1 Tax=Imperialibacter sp. TaxID=2038411 RepID=UPI0032EC8742